MRTQIWFWFWLNFTKLSCYHTLGLEMMIVGVGKCSFSKGGSRKIYKGEENYLTHTNQLLGFHSDAMTDMPIGTTTFSFQYKLPSGIPASYVDVWNSCFITYSVELIWLTDSQCLPRKKKRFTVIRDEDLNAHPELIRPISAKTCQTACCTSEPMFLKISLAKTGFAVGETALLSFSYFTESSIKISSIKIELNQILEMKGKRKNLEQSGITKKKVIDICFTPSRYDEEFGRELFIPTELPTTNIRYVNILEIRYELKIRINFSWFLAVPLRFYLPITIGTVPLTSAEASSTYPLSPPIRLPAQRCSSEFDLRKFTSRNVP